MNNQEPKTIIDVEDPTAFAWAQIAGQAAEWVKAHPQTPVVLIYHDTINGLDLQNRDRYLEVRGDLVARGSVPFQKAKILKKLYFTMKVSERKVIA